jgi:hypothetical protein
MIRKTIMLAAMSVLLGVWAASTSAAIWVTAGSARSAGGVGSTNLFEVDTTGGIVKVVGDTGENFTGLAYDPGTGLLYGTTDPGSKTPSSVFTIDPHTGAAALVGPHGVDSAIVDLAFAADGTLYGWLEPNNDDVVTIDLATGAATVVGNGPGSAGRGLDFAPDGNLVLFDGSLGTVIDPLTGLATGATIPLNGGGDINGSARTDTGLIYAINFDDSSGARYLATVDFTTGQVTRVGELAIPYASGIAIGGAAGDSDGDGIPDEVDRCPMSDLSYTVEVGICECGVTNTLMPDGCTVSDLVGPVAGSAGTNLGRKLNAVQRLGFELKAGGVLSLQDVRALVSCTQGDAVGSCWSYAK